MKFPIHSPETALPDASVTLEQVRQSFGMIPNLERVMATAPALLEAYNQLSEGFTGTSLTAREQQVVYQAINIEHGCNY